MDSFSAVRSNDVQLWQWKQDEMQLVCNLRPQLRDIGIDCII
jgi:hypothetical protein